MDVKKLDLHGVRHEEAKRQTIRFIEANWDNGSEIEIITGHSPKMKGIVINILQEYDLSYSIGYLYEVDAPRIITWT